MNKARMLSLQIKTAVQETIDIFELENKVTAVLSQTCPTENINDQKVDEALDMIQEWAAAHSSAYLDFLGGVYSVLDNEPSNFWAWVSVCEVLKDDE